MMQYTVKTPVTVRTTSRAPVTANMMIVTTSIPLSSAAERERGHCLYIIALDHHTLRFAFLRGISSDLAHFTVQFLTPSVVHLIPSPFTH